MDKPLAKLVSIDVNEISSLLDVFFSNQKPSTKEAYRKELERFYAWLQCGDFIGALRAMSSWTALQAHDTIQRYLNTLKDTCAPATINRRLAAIKTLVRFARIRGIIAWELELRPVPSRKYRDTSGPTLEQIEILLRTAAAQKAEKAARDIAIIRICFTDGLRRFEVYSLDVKDFDLDAGRVTIVGKGRDAAEPDVLPIPPKTIEAIKTWMKFRGSEAGPMFPTFHRGRKAGRLTGGGVYYIITSLGKRCGIRVRPHGIRHATATQSLENGANIHDVQKLMRHRDMKTTEAYDDNRKRLSGDTGRILDSLL